MNAVVLACLALGVTLGAAARARAQDGVIVLVEVVAKPGQRAQVLAALRRSQTRCAEWPGCRRFEIGISADDDRRFVLVELWDSIAQHKAEVAKVVSGKHFAAFRALLERDLSFRYLRVQDTRAAGRSRTRTRTRADARMIAQNDPGAAIGSQSSRPVR